MRDGFAQARLMNLYIVGGHGGYNDVMDKPLKILR